MSSRRTPTAASAAASTSRAASTPTGGPEKRMNVIGAAQRYVNRMLENVSGSKILLLDDETAAMVGMVRGFTEIMREEVYLVERLTQPNRQSQPHLKAVCFLRPTDNSADALRAELQDPKYKEYHIVFANIAPRQMLRVIAASDVAHLVHSVQEMYLDFFAINDDLFSLNIPSTSCFFSSLSWNDTAFERITDGLCAALLALKKCPIVRYQGSSDIAKSLAQEVTTRIRNEQVLFDFGRRDTPPVLLIIDRRLDPITPLLTQWSYQAMVHEYLTLENNRAKTTYEGEEQEVVLSPLHDVFFRQTMYANYGDLCDKITELGNQWAEHRKFRKIETFEDMKRFLQNMPESKELEGSIQKHMVVFSSMQDTIASRNLLTVSEIEQELACKDDHQSAIKKVMELLRNPDLQPLDLVRIAMLYALRYHVDQRSRLSDMLQILQERGIDREPLELIMQVVQYGGGPECAPELTKTSGTFSLRKKTKNLKGVDTVFTQHEPYLTTVLTALANGSLSEAEYPVARGGSTAGYKPRDVIVFIFGGATYEEALSIHRLNAEDADRSFMLGGTHVHNTYSFLADVAAMPNRS